MTHYVEMTCPRCRRGLRIRSEYLGRFVICNHCDQGFEASADSVADWKTLVGELETRIAALEHALHQAGLTRDASEREREQLVESLEWAQSEIHGLRDQLAAERQQREAAERTASEAEGLRTALNAARADLGRQRDVLQAALGQCEELRMERAAASRDAARELDGVRAERDRLAVELRDLQAQLAAKSAQVEHSRELDEVCRSLRAERDRLVAERDEHVRDLDRARDSLCVERAAFEQALAEQQTLRSDLNRAILDERGRWEATRSDLEALASQLRQHVDTRTGELRQAVDRLAEAESRAIRLEHELESVVQKHRDDQNGWVADLERAHELAHQQRERNAALRERNRQLEFDLERQAIELEAERCTREGLLADLRRQIEEHRAAWREAGERIEGEAQRLRVEAETLRVERDAALDRAEALDRRCDALAQRLETIDRSHAESNGSLRGELDRLAAALAAASRDRDEAIGLANDLARQAAELQSELDGRASEPAGANDHEDQLTLESASSRDNLPVLHNGNRWTRMPPQRASSGDEPEAPSHRPMRVVGRSGSKPIHSEMHWYMEMSRKIDELNRRRRR